MSVESVRTWLLRSATIAVLVIAFAVPVGAPIPGRLPDVALDSDWILYFERAFVIVVVLFAALIIAIRGAIEGRLPTSVSREGFEWPEEVATESADAVAALQIQVARLEEEIALVRESIDLQNGTLSA